MLMRRVLLAMLIPAGLAAQRAETGFLDRTVQVGGATYQYQVYVPSGYAASTDRWPVILFLHGAGERGMDGVFQTHVGLPAAIRQSRAKYPAIVVIPQVPTDSLWLGAPGQAAMAALERTLMEFRGDANRVYLTGLSMGGNGTWSLAYQYPDRFAAIAPICGFISAFSRLPGSRRIVPADSGDAFAAIARRLAKVPTWIFHGEIDPVVPVAESRNAADAFAAVKGNVKYTEIIGGGHNVWDNVYLSPQFQQWLFAQRRGG